LYGQGYAKGYGAFLSICGVVVDSAIFLFIVLRHGNVMTINELWYFGCFLWGLISAWAVIEGLKG
jgi:hypothetical protein